MFSITQIEEKIAQSIRLDWEEALFLYTNASLALLGKWADKINSQKNLNTVFYNKNIHIEPTNSCVFSCRFCSYYAKNMDDIWEMSIEGMLEQIADKIQEITEVHITGGVHPNWDFAYYRRMIASIREVFPDLFIKAFSAVEIEVMAKKEKLAVDKILQSLKEAGLNALPGGGAEIFDTQIREQICPEKLSGEKWIDIHRRAHLLGIPSNATILYGHIEKAEHRIAHLQKLRDIQDKTKGFNAFIPLKFKAANNTLSHLKEVSIIEDLKFFAISRIFLDNFSHIKAYWPMLGKENSSIALHFGVNDIDGTINDSTKIYSRAGQKEKLTMTEKEIRELILHEGKIPKERDSLYGIIN
jgi:aminodeoxyfutalosine synthase